MVCRTSKSDRRRVLELPGRLTLSRSPSMTVLSTRGRVCRTQPRENVSSCRHVVPRVSCSGGSLPTLERYEKGVYVEVRRQVFSVLQGGLNHPGSSWFRLQCKLLLWIACQRTQMTRHYCSCPNILF